MFKQNQIVQAVFLFMLLCSTGIFSQGIIVDHRQTDIAQIPESAVLQAKSSLHIAYGHTSHGSQLIDGMSGLVAFMNGSGMTHNLYAFNTGGSGGALDVRDTPFSGADDLGAPDFTSWASATRNYLNSHPNINVVIWSWCGQVSWASEADINTYLSLMSGLEAEFPSVHFVYMTGHLDGSGEDGTLHQNNQRIRNYCMTLDKSLFDFADIESYDPDGAVNYMQLFANDNCDYDSDGDGYQDRNWAIDWQNAHTQGTDWYDCGAAHSQSLNANRKAYAAWWLWARIAGWSGPVADTTPPGVPQNLTAVTVGATRADLSWTASADPESGVSRYRIYRDDAYIGYSVSPSYTDNSLIPGVSYKYTVSAVNGSGLESAQSGAVWMATPSDEMPPSIPAGLRADAQSSSQITLQWQASSDNSGVTGYRILRDGIEIGTTAETNYTDTGLLPAVQYRYQVSAYDAAGNASGLSEEVTASTLNPSQEIRTVRLEEAGEAVEDAFLSAQDPDGNYGEEPYVDTIDHFIIRFQLPADVMNKNIIKASLGLYVWNQTGYQPQQYMEIYPVTRAWNESEVTWNRARSGENWSVPGGDTGSEPAARILHLQGAENWDHTFYPEADLTALVQEWADGARTNYGILISNNCVTGIGLKASEYGTGSCPYLEIQYTDKSAQSVHRPAQPEVFVLRSNYPDPFNPGTTIGYRIDDSGPVRVQVFNAQGQLIRTLADGIQNQGDHTVAWDGTDTSGIRLASGLYYYSVEFKGRILTGKAHLIK